MKQKEKIYLNKYLSNVKMLIIKRLFPGDMVSQGFVFSSFFAD